MPNAYSIFVSRCMLKYQCFSPILPFLALTLLRLHFILWTFSIISQAKLYLASLFALGVWSKTLLTLLIQQTACFRKYITHCIVLGSGRGIFTTSIQKTRVESGMFFSAACYGMNETSAEQVGQNWHYI